MDALSLDQLRVFAAVVDAGGFVAAARDLARTQSAVSYAIANLERVLGDKLIVRGGQGIALTATGSAILPEVRLLLARAELLWAQAQRHAGGVEAQLTVAVDWLMPAATLVPALESWRERFPDTVLQLLRGPLGAPARAVAKGDAALGVTGRYGGMLEAFLCTPLLEVKMLCLCSPAHPLATGRPLPESETASYPQIIIPDSTSLTRGEEFTVLRGRKWYVSDLQGKLELLRGGLGWGWLPEHLVAADIDQGRLAPMYPQQMESEVTLAFSIIQLRTKVLGPAAKGFVALLCPE